MSVTVNALESALGGLGTRQRASTNNLANVIEGRARGYVDGLKAAQDHADALEEARQSEHERVLRAHRERSWTVSRTTPEGA